MSDLYDEACLYLWWELGRSPTTEELQDEVEERLGRLYDAAALRRDQLRERGW